MSNAAVQVRAFNRFYTREIGLLEESWLDSSYSLTEVRVWYELAHREEATAAELAKDLALDAGYLSRILKSFERDGLLKRKPSPRDARRQLLVLTAKGKHGFATLDERATKQISTLLEDLGAAEERRLLEAMKTIQALLAPRDASPYVIRPPRSGDFGWVVHRHGALYAAEYGWDDRFEALVADIVAKFIENYNEKRERCFIADRDGDVLGSVFLVEKSKTVAQLRLLLVEPHARGLGIGSRLVDECTRFAKQCGYRKIVLWTNDVLHAARRIYERAGYQLVHEEKHNSWGTELNAQDWQLTL